MTTFILSVLTVLAAIPAVGFLVVYSRLPWRRSMVGRGVMISMTATLLLVGMGVLRVFFGTDYAWKNPLLLAVYSVIVVGLWWMFIALLLVRYKRTS